MTKKKLGDTEIYRGGKTARHVELETKHVNLTTFQNRNFARLSFEMDSKGGGTTVVFVEIGPNDFNSLIKAMLSAERQVAMEGMADELNKQIQIQSSREKQLIKEARKSVEDAAWKKYLSATSGNDAMENFVHESVKKLVAEIEASERPA